MRLLIATFIESFATILMECGVYFFTEEVLRFTRAQNLWLALGFGAFYAVGALLSHPVASRFGEKRILMLTLLLLLAAHLALAVWHQGPPIAVLLPVIGFITGMKWPIIESYVSAGRSPHQTLRAIGKFNVTWAIAVPLAVAISGYITGSARPEAIFLLAAVCNIIVIGMLFDLSPGIEHLAHDHPDRPDVGRMVRYRALLLSARFSMIAAYSMLFIIRPIIPAILKGLGHDIETAGVIASLLDVMRVAAFALFGVWVGWHGRVYPQIIGIIGVPLGFFLIVFGNSTGMVVGGEIIFGLMTGLVYFTALYYGMVVLNASVEAGGAHEGLIGSGFAIGPALALIGINLQQAAGGEMQGMLIGLIPLVLLCVIGGAWPLLRLRQPAKT